MYSNARFANPLIARKKAPKSATDDFQVGTLAPAYDSFVPATLIPRLHKKTKQLFDTSMKTSTLYPKPEIFQLNPAIFPFSLFREGKQSITEIAAVPFTLLPPIRGNEKIYFSLARKSGSTWGARKERGARERYRELGAGSFTGRAGVTAK